MTPTRLRGPARTIWTSATMASTRRNAFGIDDLPWKRSCSDHIEDMGAIQVRRDLRTVVQAIVPLRCLKGGTRVYVDGKGKGPAAITKVMETSPRVMARLRGLSAVAPHCVKT